jgi:hypothetical protein
LEAPVAADYENTSEAGEDKPVDDGFSVEEDAGGKQD